MSRRFTAAALCAVVLAAPAGAADLEVPRGDGWYSWDVAASRTGVRSCCYGWQGGASVRGEVCDLDEQRGGYTLGGDCLLESDHIRVYVRLRDGQPDRVRALNADCPVTTATEVVKLGEVEPDSSVGWLAARVGRDGDIDAELLAAIPMHDSAAVVATLARLLEDKERPMKTREQALFWLAQSDTDEAFDYLDRLLGSR